MATMAKYSLDMNRKWRKDALVRARKMKASGGKDYLRLVRASLICHMCARRAKQILKDGGIYYTTDPILRDEFIRNKIESKGL